VARPTIFVAKMGLHIDATHIDSNDLMVLNPDLDSLIDGIERLTESKGRWGGSIASEHVYKRFN
jgi:hypothetical protein